VTDARTLAWVLWQTSRPDQLLLILGVYLFGVKIALAKGATAPMRPLIAGALAILPVAASVHYANEYADYETDRYNDNRTQFSGGSGAMQAANVDREIVLQAATAALALGMTVTAVVALMDLLTVEAVGLLAVIAVLGWQYSVGPLRLAWRGWGELDNAVLGGLLLPVYGAAVVSGNLRVVALASIPFFLLVLLNLFATQWPDREADAAAGKRTLAVRWSATRLRRAYASIAIAAGLSLFVLTPGILPVPVALASLLVVPLVCWGWYGYTRREVPWPTVFAMLGLLALQFLAWCWVDW